MLTAKSRCTGEEIYQCRYAVYYDHWDETNRMIKQRYENALRQHNGEQYRVLKLEPADPMSEDHPPALSEPVLLGFALLALRLRGLERVEDPDGGYSVVQEWHIEMP